MDLDVIVVGAGFAGLTAAARATEHGLSVAVFERGEGPDYWCNSRVCTGVYHIGFLGETEPEDVLFDRIMGMTGGTANPDLARTFAATSRGVKDWLRTQGAEFQPYHSQPSGLSMMAPARALSPGLDWRGKGPDLFLRRLARKVTDAAGVIHLGSAVRRLIVEDGVCVGVEADRAGVETTFRASTVVLADGGFQADVEQVAKNITRAAGRLQQRNTGTGVGDGLRMAQAAGADLVGLDKFYGHLLSRDAMAHEQLWPYPQVDVIAATSVLIDGRGQRFADEGLGGVYMVNAIAQLDDPLSAIVVFDSETWEAAKSEDIVPPNPSLPETGGTLHRADDLVGLAAMIDVPQAALNATVAEYNVAIMADALGQLVPRRTAEKYKPRPIQTPPFYAIPVCAGITVTMGGIAIDGDARVLRSDGKPIPGLFAAGSTAGGVEGGPQAGYIGGVAKAFVLGYRAAETIAADHGKG